MNPIFIQNTPFYTVIPTPCANLMTCIPVMTTPVMSLNGAVFSLNGDNNQVAIGNFNPTDMIDGQQKDELLYYPIGSIPGGVPIVYPQNYLMPLMPQMGLSYFPTSDNMYQSTLFVNSPNQFPNMSSETKDFCNCKLQENCNQQSGCSTTNASEIKPTENEKESNSDMDLAISAGFRIPNQDKTLGLYSPTERFQKVVKYKLKVKKRREKVPVCRDFPGRSLAAKIKLRKDGKFANSKEEIEKDSQKIKICKENNISENLEHNCSAIIINDSD